MRRLASVPFAIVALLAAAPPARALLVCARADKATGAVKDGADVKLRAACKAPKEVPVDVFSLVVAGPQTCTAQDVADAQQVQAQAQARVAAGVAPQSEVVEAIVYSAEVGLCAATLTRDDYCSIVPVALDQLILARSLQWTAGTATIDQVLAARRRSLAARAFCAGT